MARIRGTKNNDILDGTDDADTLMGRRGDDLLNGGLGNDKLKGGKGNDTLRGEGGDDHYIGGDGIDTAVFLDDIQNHTFLNWSKGIKLSHLDGAGADGNDKVRSDVERLQFGNVIVEQEGEVGNYAPAAFDDAASTDETTSVDIDPLANDIDVNHDALTLTAINGTAVSAGDTITLASGAQLIVNASGAVSYSAAGAVQGHRQS